MHRHLYAQCRIQLELKALSPILVQGEQNRQTASFHRSIDPADGQEKYVIPATSLKGVWRSTAERILRSADERLACDPFAEKGTGQSCSHRLEEARYEALRNTTAIHAAMCPACRLFGSTAHAGLIQIEDAWPLASAAEDIRTSIAIDRFTAGAKHGALYTYAPLPSSIRFAATVDLQNVEMWYIGLLALVCREMGDGAARLGSGARKGLGHVQPNWLSLRLRLPNIHRIEPDSDATTLYGWITKHADTSDGVRTLPSRGWQDSLWRYYEVTGAALDMLKSTSVADALGPRLKKGCAGFDYSTTAHAQGG